MDLWIISHFIIMCIRKDGDKGSSTDFDGDVWYKTLNKALHMDELITRHGTIMDKYDPEKK